MSDLSDKAGGGTAARPFASDFTEILQAWLEQHRRSPLDGTISCQICRALVLEENAAGHYMWHACGQLPNPVHAEARAKFHASLDSADDDKEPS